MDPTVISVPVLVGIGGLAAAFTEFIKRTIIDKHIYKPTDPAHDTFVRGVCFVVALLLTVLSIVPAFPGTGVGWLTLLFQAAASAGISISGYHIVTGSASPAGTGASSPAAPTATDLATAFATVLTPVLARLAPTPPASATVPPAATPPQSPAPGPAASAAPPAQP